MPSRGTVNAAVPPPEIVPLPYAAPVFSCFLPKKPAAVSAGAGDHRGRSGHYLGRGDELIERLAPALAEAHPVMGVAAFLVLVHGQRRVFRALPMRLHRDD